MKVLAIIQARTDSSRLPKKVLLKINNKTIIEYIVDFLKHSKLIDEIVIATTTLHTDDEIEELAKQIGIHCFRGSSDDVLNRYYECAKSFYGDLIVRVTADDPIIDPYLVDEIISLCKKTKCDYVSTVLHQTFPFGFTACEVFPFSVLELMNSQLKDDMSREHVTYHIRQNPSLYNTREICAEPSLARPNWRLSIDHPEDFQLVSEILSKLIHINDVITYASLVAFLDNNKQLSEINAKYNLLY